MVRFESFLVRKKISSLIFKPKRKFSFSIHSLLINLNIEKGTFKKQSNAKIIIVYYSYGWNPFNLHCLFYSFIMTFGYMFKIRSYSKSCSCILTFLYRIVSRYILHAASRYKNSMHNSVSNSIHDSIHNRHDATTHWIGWLELFTLLTILNIKNQKIRLFQL